MIRRKELLTKTLGLDSNYLSCIELNQAALHVLEDCGIVRNLLPYKELQCGYFGMETGQTETVGSVREDGLAIPVRRDSCCLREGDV